MQAQKFHMNIITFRKFFWAGILFLLGLNCPAEWHHHWTAGERELGTSIIPDFYHSYANLYYQLQREPPVYIFQESETGLYRDLLKRSYLPSYALVELTLYPTTTLSAWIASNHRDFYDQFTVIGDINLIGSISGGYQEPWSVSLFLGQLAPFITMDDEENLLVVATGVGGLVLTGGLYQIFNNCLLRSDWYRIEWKLKGESLTDSIVYDWDIKIGYRHYGLREIDNTLLFCYTRDRMSLGRFDWRWLENSRQEFELQFPLTRQGGRMSRLRLIYGKAIPFRRWMIGLGIGVIYENRRQYEGETGQFSSQNVERWNFFLTPFAYW